MPGLAGAADPSTAMPSGPAATDHYGSRDRGPGDWSISTCSAALPNGGPFPALQICTRRYLSGVNLRDRIRGDAHSEGLTLIKGAHASGEDHAGIPASNDLRVRTEPVSRKW